MPKRSPHFWGRWGAFAGNCVALPDVTEYQSAQEIYEGMLDDVEAQFGKKAAKDFADGFHDAYASSGLTPFWER